MKAPITLIPLVLLSSLLTAAHSAEALPSGSLPAFCGLAPDSTSNTWTGGGATDNWEDPANWSDPNGYPGSIAGGDPDACIPTGGTPVINGDPLGQEGHVRTLDVASGATITVQPGAKLFMYGDQTADQDSVIRQGGRIDVVGGTLGGIAKLHVLGTVALTHDSAGAATVLTRDCTYDSTPGGSYPGEDDCVPAATPTSGPTFRLEVDDSGIADVQGGGVNLGDGTTTIVRGLLRVRSGAYIAADHGTRLELRPHRTPAAGTGTLRFEGDGGYLEGKIQSDTGVAAQSALVNQGLIIKTGGTGRTLVSATYSQPAPGKTSVRTGTLLLPRGFDIPASVGAGVTYGTGQCVVAQSTSCGVQTTGGDPDRSQFADFRVPSTDTSGANVVVQRLPRKRVATDLGFPFKVHATSLNATAANPAVIRLRFDASILRGKHWSQVTILRQATTTSKYLAVKACTSTGRPPAGQVACVDRRRKAGVSSRDLYTNGAGKAPDVLMVIRTRGTSRWVGR